jgi:hypothetical protein
MDVDAQWRQVENSLQGRNALLLNFVNAVQQYAPEGDASIVRMTSALDMWEKAVDNGRLVDKMKAESVIVGAIPGLISLAAKYPPSSIQTELADAEKKVELERMKYNNVVKIYNEAAGKFPLSVVVEYLTLPAERSLFELPKSLAAPYIPPPVNVVAPVTPKEEASKPSEDTIEEEPTAPPPPPPAPIVQQPAAPAAVIVGPKPPSAIMPSPTGPSGTLQPNSPTQIAPNPIEPPPAPPSTPKAPPTPRP